MKYAIILFQLFFLLVFSISKVGSTVKDYIPIKKLGHLITVKARINDSPDEYTFIVDTGALTFVDLDVAKALELKQRGMMAKIDTLDLAGFRIENVFCITAFDFSRFRRLGMPIHGIIGSNLLERYTATIDFEAGGITLSSDTTAMAPPENALVMTFRNHPVNNAPLVKLTVGSKEIEGMIDTGQPYPLVLPLASFEEYRESEVVDFIQSTGLMEEWPNTTANINYLARLRSMAVGGLKLEHVVCLFGELPAMLSMPLIGNDLLSQFRLVIDYPRDELMLIPYHDVNIKDNMFSIGLRFDVSDENEVFVKGVWDGSPAAEAGVEIGDVIVSLDSKPLIQDSLIELVDMMRDDDTKSITLEVRRGEAARKVTLEKALLFK